MAGHQVSDVCYSVRSCLLSVSFFLTSSPSFRFAYAKSVKAAKLHLNVPIENVSYSVQPVYARVSTCQPVNRVAGIRQFRRHFSSASFVDSIRSGLLAGERSAYKAPSRITSNIGRLTKRAPFASTLRPSLTGGTLVRTAGGYAIGAGRIGGTRYFSQGAAAPAQVVNNVSAAMRAFLLSGSKVRYDGIDPKSGNKRFKTLSRLQNEAENKLDKTHKNAPGTSVDFQISPTVTALGALGGLNISNKGYETKTLNSDGLMDLLSVDFARALKDLAAVLNDLKRLELLGDLPVFLHDKSTIRVRFPGCDAETVERLCDEVGVQRGRIVQDEDFDLLNGVDLALRFPFAPSIPASAEEQSQSPVHYFSPEEIDWRDMMMASPREDQSPNSLTDPILVDRALFVDNPWTRSSSGYSSINVSELGDRVFFPELSCEYSPPEYGGI